MLTAALIAATDHAKELDELVVTVLAASDTVEIALETRSGANVSHAEQDAYRLLDWDDVQTLANFHDLHFSRVSNELVKIRISQI